MKRPLASLQSLPLYAAGLGLTPSCAFVAGSAALLGDRTGKIWWPASQFWARGLTDAAGVTDFIVQGVEVLYDGAPYVLMANHESHLDPPSFIRASDRPIGFLTKKELERIPVFGWALRRTGHVFIDRKNRDQSHASIARAAEAVREGRCILVFPEGTRGQADDLLPFKKGGFVLALEARVSIVPCGIAGTRQILPAHSKFVNQRGPVALVFGDPIPTHGHTHQGKGRLMDEVRTTILALREQARALVAERMAAPSR